MPGTCPHCGISLPAVVDAFCPECREDLSVTPEEAQRTVEGTFKAVTGAFLGSTGSPEDARAKSAGYALMLTGVAVVGLVASVLARDWDKVILASILLTLGALWLRGEYRQSVVRASVTKSGNPFTKRESEEAK